MSNRALVTGGAGFIGSHLVDALLAEGYEVDVVDDLSSGDARNVAEAARLHTLDITDRAALHATVERAAPRAIFHLAAQASVVASVEDPGRDCEVNVQGTLNVVDVAGRVGVPVVFTSTGGALYGDEAPRPTPEERIPAPLSPYGASKWAAEAYVNTWSLSTGVPHAVCRLGNVYGPRQSPHGEAGVVAIFSHHLHTGRTPTLYGQGTPTRDYVYVEDVVRALLAASGRRGTYNVATGVETDVNEHLDGASRSGVRCGRPRVGGPPSRRVAPQLPQRREGRARARLARGGPDRGGPAPYVRCAGRGVPRARVRARGVAALRGAGCGSSAGEDVARGPATLAVAPARGRGEGVEMLCRATREALASGPGRGPASGQIAQLVEHTTENRGVPSSSLGLAIYFPHVLGSWCLQSERVDMS